MNIDISRLKVLRKKFDSYLMFHIMDWDDKLLENLRDDNVIEYDEIKKNVELDLSIQLKIHSESLFKNVNLCDFDIDKIGSDLLMLATTHWTKRNKDEILRDKLLDIDFSFYT